MFGLCALLAIAGLRTLNPRWLRTVVGVVQQEPVLFNGTVAENLRLGRDTATDEDLRLAAQQANALDFIEALPQVDRATTQFEGFRDSSWQRRCPAFRWPATATLYCPSPSSGSYGSRSLERTLQILLLDEATSALDTESEAIVQSALDKAAEGRTTIVVAHRLSTVRNANLIVVFEKGVIKEKGRLPRIVESLGTHDELIVKGGLYARMVATQQVQKVEEQEAERIELVRYGFAMLQVAVCSRSSSVFRARALTALSITSAEHEQHIKKSAKSKVDFEYSGGIS